MLPKFGRDEWLLLAALGVAAVLAFFKNSIASGVAAVSNDPSFTQFDSLFQSYGRQYRVPWRWMKAIAMNESNLGQERSVAAGISNPSDVDASVSSDGLSWGLMQVTLTTARALEGDLIQAPYLNVPDNSVRLAAKLLQQLITRFGIDDRQSVIRAYNGGPRFGATTLPYYTRFVANLGVVMAKQPGDELEGNT